MAIQDMTQKALEAYNDVFADIVNNLVFDGEEVVTEGELEQGRDRNVYRGERLLREIERDTSKYWRRNGIRIAYVGMENEMEPEDDMLYRVIGYDGAAYRDQIAYEIGGDGKRRKTVTRHPVMTLVLYFGYEKRWDKAKSLYDVFGGTLDERMRRYVHNYPINLFEVAYLTDEQVKGFKSDFRIVADYFVQMRKTGTYMGTLMEVRHMREVLQLLSFLTDDIRFENVVDDTREGDEPKNMSEVLDRVERRGMEQGIEQGIERGEDRLGELIRILLTSGRSDDALKASSDREERARLFAELEIQ